MANPTQTQTPEFQHGWKLPNGELSTEYFWRRVWECPGAHVTRELDYIRNRIEIHNGALEARKKDCTGLRGVITRAQKYVAARPTPPVLNKILPSGKTHTAFAREAFAKGAGAAEVCVQLDRILLQRDVLRGIIDAPRTRISYNSMRDLRSRVLRQMRESVGV